VRRARLKVVRGADKGKELELGDRETALLGSHPDADLILTDDTVSRQHAEIRAAQQGYIVRDLGSTNGVRVNGVHVLEAVLDKKTSTLSLGQTDLEWKLLSEEVEHALSPRRSFGHVVGETPAMRSLFANLERIATTDGTVLLAGESGTGKEALAEGLHQASSRAEGPFIVVDCGAIAPNLVESELFGHEKGAFTGADRTRTGAFEEAHKGTLFLDEIGELPLEMQPRLLRVLEERKVRRVGATRYFEVDVRVVAATNRKLDRLVSEGKFRADLYYRLAVITVAVPPLRAHPEDILPLARHFILQMRPDAEPDELLTPGVCAALAGYRWPGNVRELRNAIERLLAMGELDSRLRTRRETQAADYHTARQTALDQFEREYCRTLLAQAGGVVARAAEQAGISRQMFHRLLRRHELVGE
jgi:transcriptional regulator with PAS, ATPase and Fis domain